MPPKKLPERKGDDLGKKKRRVKRQPKDLKGAIALVAGRIRKHTRASKGQ